MGKPKHVVCGDICMRLSTSGGLVDSLMPSKDNESLVRVLGELTQNVMDWAFGEASYNVPKLRIPGDYVV